MFHSCIEYIELYIYFIRNKVLVEEFLIQHIPSHDEQPANHAIFHCHKAQCCSTLTKLEGGRVKRVIQQMTLPQLVQQQLHVMVHASITCLIMRAHQVCQDLVTTHMATACVALVIKFLLYNSSSSTVHQYMKGIFSKVMCYIFFLVSSAFLVSTISSSKIIINVRISLILFY